MNGFLAPTEHHLIKNLETTLRGPKRNGLFAVWLLVRVCDGMLPPLNLSPKANGRRLEGLKRRLSSLTMQPPLRRALTGCLRELEAGTPDAACLALRQLEAPVRDVLGTDTAEAVSWATQRAKRTTMEAGTDSA